jgi:hypothetical protein
MPFALGNMQQARGLYRRSGIGFIWHISCQIQPHLAPKVGILLFIFQDRL